MIIRKAILADAERIGYINSASWRTTYTGLIDDKAFEAMTPEAMLAKWTHIISSYSTDSFVLVAEVNSEVVGYIFCGPNDHSEKSEFEWVLFGLYLLKEHQGKGIGKGLFREAVKEMKRRDVGSFVLFVLSSNTGSRKFYESFQPDFTDGAKVTIGNIEYDDTVYGWRSISSFRCN